MAYPRTRSAIDELNQGMSDGTYKQVSRDRGGVIEPATYAARKGLSDIWYGIHEATIKELPDALPAHTPTTVSTLPASPPYV
jgi:phage tail protein X